jgi:hypothetical protein
MGTRISKNRDATEKDRKIGDMDSADLTMMADA